MLDKLFGQQTLLTSTQCFYFFCTEIVGRDLVHLLSATYPRVFHESVLLLLLLSLLYQDAPELLLLFPPLLLLLLLLLLLAIQTLPWFKRWLLACCCCPWYECEWWWCGEKSIRPRWLRADGPLREKGRRVVPVWLELIMAPWKSYVCLLDATSRCFLMNRCV